MARAPAADGARSAGFIAVLVALAASVPFLRGLLGGQCLFFRDLSLYFFPLRRYVVEGLLRGELRFWNPLVHEGKQELFPAVGYPLDLLQLAWPDERGFTLLLAGHVPLCALTFFGLGRGLGLSAAAAAGGALVYALGGFALSLVNLYDYVLAAAWAPLVALAFVRLSTPRAGTTAGAALAAAVLVSTGRVEVIVQAFALAFVLAWAHAPRDAARQWRSALALLLAAGLSAPVWIVMAGVMRGSSRAAGLDTGMVLAHAIHPVTFGQVLVANLHGDLANPVGRWWGDPFFSGGFPYFLSLYLGPVAVALALHGVRPPSAWRNGLVALALLAVWVSLGPFGGWAPLLEAAPFLRRLRFPAKAFYTIHFVVALFGAVGLDRLQRGPREGRPWRRYALLAVLLAGVLLLAVPLAMRLAPSSFFPAAYLEAQRGAVRQAVGSDAALGGLIALAAAAVAWLADRGRLTSTQGVGLLVFLVGADLVRAGTGLNPMVTPPFFARSSEMQRVAEDLNRRGARVYTCHAPTSESYRRTTPPQAEDRDVRMFTVLRETLTPSMNLPDGPPSAYSSDLTQLIPTTRTLEPRLTTCAAVPMILDRLRMAGVSHVVSLDPLAAAELTLEAVVRPARIAPLAVHVYALAGALPRRGLATRVESAPDAAAAVLRAAEPGFQASGAVVVEGAAGSAGSRGSVRSVEESPDSLTFEIDSDRPGILVVRDAYAPEWQAKVDGVRVPLLRADGRHRAVPVPAGRSLVNLTYRPPGYRISLTLLLVAGMGTAVTLMRDRRRLREAPR